MAKTNKINPIQTLTPVDVSDVQSLVFTGYGKFAHSYILWMKCVGESEAACSILRTIVQSEVTFGKLKEDKNYHLNLAFSANGIQALGTQLKPTDDVDRPFLQGIATPRRSRAFGDLEQNSYENWRWDDQDGHLVIMIYANESEKALTLANRVRQKLLLSWETIHEIETFLPKNQREPFGFRDGISNVRVGLKSQSDNQPGVTWVPPGEIILGQEDATGLTFDGPQIYRNGSFLVIRQLEQDVHGFWQDWHKQALGDEDKTVWLASKAVGRWPNGMPLTQPVPTIEPLPVEMTILQGPNFARDPHGIGCPFGAHIRRANPREGLTEDPQISMDITGLHHMIRRGRIYGPPAPREWYPKSLANIMKADGQDPSSGRGLIFMNLCANIARQFEFVQQTWLNQPKFADLYGEVDPIAGGAGVNGDNNWFTIPRDGVRLRLSGVYSRVTVRGGGYFLLPGKNSLQSLLGKSS